MEGVFTGSGVFISGDSDMKAKEVKVGDVVLMKVSGAVQRVRIDAIRETFGMGKSKTVYDCTNLATGRKCSARSPSKFRGIVTPKLMKHQEEMIEQVQNAERKVFATDSTVGKAGYFGEEKDPMQPESHPAGCSCGSPDCSSNPVLS